MEKTGSLFYLTQIGLGAGLVFLLWYMRQPKSGSNFKYREADRPKTPGGERGAAADLAKAKMQKKGPLALTGIRLDGAPHEILGVRAGAPAAEIQKAYRELMKRYHPDKVGRPGTREWQDAQKIAETINRAKDEMLQSQSPNRSGR